jgi:transposase-like protein
MGQERKRKEVVEEYLRGGESLRELAQRHGIGHGTIHRWVKAYESGGDAVMRRRMRVAVTSTMPEDVKRLQRELYEARLHTKLLETMIDIAEEDLGIVIRKKSGAKQ